MKKTFCVLLAFLMLLPFCPVNSAVASLSDASLAFDGGGLVTLGRPYTVSLGQAAYCSGNGDDLGIKLTITALPAPSRRSPRRNGSASTRRAPSLRWKSSSSWPRRQRGCSPSARISPRIRRTASICRVRWNFSARPTAQATPCSARESWIRWTTGRSAGARIPRPNASRCAI